jgi:transcriptional regulator with XRE-family HTH domain
MPPKPKSRLKQRRLELNLTQMQVAKGAGISQPTYQNYEAGTTPISPENLPKLARVLKMTAVELEGDQIRRPVKLTLVPKPKQHIEVIDSNFDASPYWGEISLHFHTGNPIVLPISATECERLFGVLQSHQTLSQFIFIFTLSNQIVAVRRSALTDLCFSRDEADTYGPEHNTYRDLDVVEDVTSQSQDYWEVAERVFSDGVQDNIDSKYGTQVVQQVSQDLDFEWHKKKIEELISKKEIKAEEREAAIDDVKDAIRHVRELALKVKWQLSNGKVRSEYFDAEDMSQLDWIGTEFDPEGPFIVENSDGGQWHFINPESIDYISIPAHAYIRWAATLEVD